MLTIARKQLKVLKMIVVFHPISVVNNFRGQEKAPKSFLHYETMFKDIVRVFSGIWMTFAMYGHIAVLVHQATLPRIVLLSKSRFREFFHHSVASKKFFHFLTLRSNSPANLDKIVSLFAHLKHFYGVPVASGVRVVSPPYFRGWNAVFL